MKATVSTHIAPLGGVSRDAIEALLDRAFGADRKTRTAYRLRAGTTAIPRLSFAAFGGGGDLLGTLQIWPVALVDAGSFAPLVMIGPVAVDPAFQRDGVGTDLMTALLAATGDAPLMMIGDPEYYGRFGFTADATGGWIVDGPVERHRLLARGAQGLPGTGKLTPLPAFREGLGVGRA